MQQNTYDYHAACHRIDELYFAAEEHACSSAMFPTQFVQKVADDEIQPVCLPSGDPATHRLLQTPAGDDNLDTTEFEFRLIGSVEKLDLPPFERRLLNSSRIRFLQQRIGVSAPNSSKFATNVAALFRALELISTLAPHHVDHSNIDNTCLTFGNRLFCAKDYSHTQDIAAITHSTDPTGELAKAAAAAHLVHTEDNTVEYLRTNGSDFLPITPVSIHCGDIVEIRFSIVLFHNSKTTLFSKLVLRAIISLDTSFAQALRFTNPSSIKHTNVMPIRRKRVQDSIICSAPVVKRIRLSTTQTKSDIDSDEDSPDVVRMVEDEISDLRLGLRSSQNPI